MAAAKALLLIAAARAAPSPSPTAMRWSSPPLAPAGAAEAETIPGTGTIGRGRMPDAPLVGNGDLGATLGANLTTGELTLYLGLNQMWFLNAYRAQTPTPPPHPKPPPLAQPPGWQRWHPSHHTAPCWRALTAGRQATGTTPTRTRWRRGASASAASPSAPHPSPTSPSAPCRTWPPRRSARSSGR